MKKMWWALKCWQGSLLLVVECTREAWECLGLLLVLSKSSRENYMLFNALACAIDVNQGDTLV